MSNQLSLEKRTVQGKQLKSLRRTGQIPSVIYGSGDPILTSSEYIATDKVLREAGYHSPIQLSIAGQPQLAITKTVAIDPVSRRIISIEFQAISADEIVEATTPIRIVNFDQSEAAKLHLTIMPVLEEIEVKAKPSNLPEELTIDGSKLASAEDRLTIADIILPNGVELADKELDPTTVVANVFDSAAEAAARDAEDEQAEETTEAVETSSAEQLAKQ